MGSMTDTPPTSEKPSPEALAAARQAFLDTGDRLATLQGGQRMRFLTVEEVALVADRYTTAQVEAERERCCKLVLHEAKHWPATGEVQDQFVNIYKRIRSGEQP